MNRDNAEKRRRQNEAAPPLGGQRRGQSLNDQHHPGKGTDMGNEPSIPSVTEALAVGEEPAFDIDELLLRCDGEAMTVPPYIPLIRHTQASVLETALALEAAGISVIPLDADGNPAIENWEEYQHRRATREEIIAWFGPKGSTPGAP